MITPTVHAQSWQAIAPMAHARYDGFAVALKSGKILIAGGVDGTNVLSSCELYDPISDSWQETGSLLQARFHFDMVSLPDGRVLAGGGLTDFGTSTTSSCEIYDPSSGTWKSTSSLSEAREGGIGMALPDGRVLFVGGLDANLSTALASIDVFDPTSEKMSQLPPMPNAIYASNAFFLPSINSLIVTGGQNGGTNGFYFKSTQLFSFATNSWYFADSLNSPHTEGHQHVQMPDGTVLLPSGRSGEATTTTLIEKFDPIGLKWTILGNTLIPHVWARNYPIGNDSILLIGGIDASNLPSALTLSQCEWINVQTGQVTEAPPLLGACAEYSSVMESNPDSEIPCDIKGAIYVFGGADSLGHPTSLSQKLMLSSSPGGSLVGVTPAQLILRGNPCSPDYDTSLIFSNASCDTILIDSIIYSSVYTRSNASIQAVPVTILRGNIDSIQLRLSLDYKDSDGAITVYYHSPNGVYKFLVQVQREVPNPSSSIRLSPIIEVDEPLCASSDTVIPIVNSGCRDISILSATILGMDSLYFAVVGSLPLPQIPTDIQPGDTLFVTIECSPTMTRNYLASLSLSCVGFDTVINLIWRVSSSTVPTVPTIISDQTANSGDTVTMPLYLIDNRGTTIEGIRISLVYNTNLVEMLPPTFLNTVFPGSPIYDLQKTPTGADLFFPGVFNTSATLPIANLRFSTFVTDTDCCTVAIRKIVIAPDLTNGNCILNVVLDSATLCITPQCGDLELQSLLRARTLQILRAEPDLTGSTLCVKYVSTTEPEFELINMLGQTFRRFSGMSGAGSVEMDVHSLPQGVYLLVVSSSNSVQSRKIILKR